jgi:hypothetical protein
MRIACRLDVDLMRWNVSSSISAVVCVGLVKGSNSLKFNPAKMTKTNIRHTTVSLKTIVCFLWKGSLSKLNVVLVCL